jgi:hypothetical protein
MNTWWSWHVKLTHALLQHVSMLLQGCWQGCADRCKGQTPVTDVNNMGHACVWHCRSFSSALLRPPGICVLLRNSASPSSYSNLGLVLERCHQTASMREGVSIYYSPKQVSQHDQHKPHYHMRPVIEVSEVAWECTVLRTVLDAWRFRAIQQHCHIYAHNLTSLGSPCV